VHIAILGSGLMGSALGSLWARAGHNIDFSYSRDRKKLQALARGAGSRAKASAPNEAVRAAEVVLVSVPWHRMDDALAAAGAPDAFSRKVVVTCSLPMLADDSDLALGHDTSGAEELARRVPGARIVVAFNTIPSEIMRPELLRAAAERGEKPAVVICGDDATAKVTAASLAMDAGFDPVNAGPLRASRWIEPFGLLIGQLAYAQHLGPELGYRFIRATPHAAG
jgi:predicted dinucleotide-binding enzyme